MSSTPQIGEIEVKVVAAYLAPFYADLVKWRYQVQEHLAALRRARESGNIDKVAFAEAETTRNGLDAEILQFDAAVEHLGGKTSAAADQLGEIGGALQNLRSALMRILVLMQEIM